MPAHTLVLVENLLGWFCRYVRVSMLAMLGHPSCLKGTAWHGTTGFLAKAPGMFL